MIKSLCYENNKKKVEELCGSNYRQTHVCENCGKIYYEIYLSESAWLKKTFT